MFYSQSLLSRKGPLGNIWMAAYCFKRLRREQIAGTDISSSIDKIMPEVQISYRVLAQLLLGIVRIFSKKVDYLYLDCTGALTNIRKSFMPSHGSVPKEAIIKQQHNVAVAKEVIHAPNPNATASKEAILVTPIEEMCAPYHHITITVPERFELDTFQLDGADGGDGDTAKSQEHSILQDGLTEERNGASFMNEFYYREKVAHTEFDYACFTPVNDVLPSDMMDIYLNVSEFCNSSSLEVKRQELQGSFWHPEESDKHERHGARMSLGSHLHDEEPEDQAFLLNFQETLPSDVDKENHTEEPKDHVKPIKLHETELTDYEKPHILTEGHLGTIIQAKTHDTPNSPFNEGLASPKFVVTTPAKRERLRILRKRKNFFDEIIVLSNETLRLGIHDASSLVCKRRKSPHTILDAWKAYRITILQQRFMDPLFPYISSELKALFQKKFSDHSSLRKTGDSLNDEFSIQKDTHNKFSDMEPLLHERTSMEISAPADHSEPPASSKSIETEVRESCYTEISDTGLDSMDLELIPHEKGSNDQDDGWSIRTRMVAQFLHSRLKLKEREKKGTLSLTQILEGKTRTRCARFFYETLALESRGCIDVKQDSPYGDIAISATPQLEAMFGNH